MISLARRKALKGLIAASLIFTAGTFAEAQDKYPIDTVKLITHSSPGGGSDVFLREMVPHLQPYLGTTVVVENRQGGSGAKALAYLVGQPADGSIFYATTPTYIYTSLLSQPEATYKDVEPLVNVFYDPEIVYTAIDSKFQTLDDVIKAAKEGRGKWGAANPASLERQLLEQMKKATGANASIVTFEGGGDMLINVLNQSLDIGVGEVQEVRSQLEAKKIRVLAILGDERLTQFPDVKTAKEQGVPVAAVKFRGLAGPKGLPKEIIAAWEAAIPKLLEDPKYKEIYTANNLQPGFIKHDDYIAFITKFGGDTESFLRDSGVIK